MIDPKILKENPKTLREMLERRKVSYPLDELLELDGKRRELIIETQNLRHKKNTLSQSIANKKKKQESAETELGEMKNVGEMMSTAESKRITVEKRYDELIYSIPNLLHESVPTGKSEEDNIVV
ncbi:MAG TPA: serine--tRNA ligase, partial [Nitrososphaeraceae archaeon]